MAKANAIEIRLTLAEAKAVSRLLNAAIADIRTDPTHISNEATMERAITHAEQVAEKIKIAMANVGSLME